jgi:hypothetical protein
MKTVFRFLLPTGLAAVLAACGSSAPLEPGAPPSPVTARCAAVEGPSLLALKQYEGTMHAHSSYSDGDIHTVPADYYRQIREAGYAFAGGSEHSDTLDPLVFISLGNDCFTTPDGLLTCLTPTPDELVKWQRIEEQAAAASDEDFFAIRGFEWTSDRFGHINVYFSRNFSNAKTDLGYLVTMETFWQWFARDPDTPGLGGSLLAPVPLGGGADGLAHFNHPSDKCLTDSDPGCNWNDYTLIPEAVPRMFGMEVYNDRNGADRYQADYVRALDAGWRLSPIGAEDEHELEFGSEVRPKTVTLATSLDEAGFREAWMARRTYALSPGEHLRATLVVDAQAPMGAQLRCPSGSDTIPMEVRLEERDGQPFIGRYQLFGSGGDTLAAVPADSEGRARFSLPVVADETRWYFVRADRDDGTSAAYLAPVWIHGD